MMQIELLTRITNWCLGICVGVFIVGFIWGFYLYLDRDAIGAIHTLMLTVFGIGLLFFLILRIILIFVRRKGK